MIKKMMVVAASAAAVVLGTPAAWAAGSLAAAPAASGRVVHLVVADVPGRAWETLHKIDADVWPPQDGSGTRGGAAWPNRDGALPRTDAEGAPIHYRVWDVNHKKPGRPRDGERIVTGDDGTAWYTPDNGRTFSRMR